MKKLYYKFRQFTEKAIYNDKILLVISMVLAIFVWGYITNLKYPDADEILKNVAIDYEASLAGTPAGEEGYRIYDPDISSVDIRIAANRTVLGYLNKNSFYAKVSTNNYTDEQPVTVNLQLFKADGNDIDCDYQLLDVKKAKVYFYKEITKNVDVSINAPNITAADGYRIKNITCSSVSVTGPEPYVNMISGCSLYLPQNVSYDFRKSLSVQANLQNLTFFNEEGENINELLAPYYKKDQFRINKTDLSVMINVSMVKNLDITYSLTDVPDYFDQDFILKRLSLSVPSIAVSSDDPALENMDTLPVATEQNISLSKIGIDFSTTFDLNKALESYPKLSNDTKISACYVNFDNTGISEKTFEGISSDHFIIKNPYESSYKVELITQRLPNVTIVGPAEDLAKLTADDLTVEIDILKSEISDNGNINPGITTIKARVLPPKGCRNVWVFGEYPVDIEISELPDEPEFTSASHQAYPSPRETVVSENSNSNY